LLRPVSLLVSKKPRLLVSFSSADEFRAVSDLPFDWIDLKSPHRGSLGCPQPAEAVAFSDIARIVAKRNRCPISLALGELHTHDWASMIGTADKFDFVKVGLSNCLHDPNWQNELELAAGELRMEGRLIPAYYADHKLALSPSWGQVLQAARHLGTKYVLIDTFDKLAGRLWNWLPPEQLASCRSESLDAGVELAVAGSLALDELEGICAMGIPIVGVRGAVCEFGSRRQAIDRARLNEALKIFGRFDQSCDLRTRPSDQLVIGERTRKT
jgi:uncharacterized protein (UPF0264 family)